MHINQKPFKVYFFSSFCYRFSSQYSRLCNSGSVVAKGTQGNGCRAWYFHKVFSRRIWIESWACPALWWRMDTSPSGNPRHACAVLAGGREWLRLQTPECRCAGVDTAAGAPRGDLVVLVKEKHLFFSKFYTASPKVAFLIKQTQKGYLGFWLTSSEQAIVSQHGSSYHAVNERSALGFSHRGMQLQDSPWQSVWERGVQQAEPGAAVLHLSSTSADLACPAPILSCCSSCLPGQLGWRQTGTLLLLSLDVE